MNPFQFHSSSSFPIFITSVFFPLSTLLSQSHFFFYLSSFSYIIHISFPILLWALPLFFYSHFISFLFLAFIFGSFFSFLSFLFQTLFFFQPHSNLSFPLFTSSIRSFSSRLLPFNFFLFPPHPLYLHVFIFPHTLCSSILTPSLFPPQDLFPSHFLHYSFKLLCFFTPRPFLHYSFVITLPFSTATFSFFILLLIYQFNLNSLHFPFAISSFPYFITHLSSPLPVLFFLFHQLNSFLSSLLFFYCSTQKLSFPTFFPPLLLSSSFHHFSVSSSPLLTFFSSLLPPLQYSQLLVSAFFPHLLSSFRSSFPPSLPVLSSLLSLSFGPISRLSRGWRGERQAIWQQERNSPLQQSYSYIPKVKYITEPRALTGPPRRQTKLKISKITADQISWNMQRLFLRIRLYVVSRANTSHREESGYTGLPPSSSWGRYGRKGRVEERRIREEGRERRREKS